MNIIYWAVGIVIIGGLLYFIDREVYFYEGARLGARIQSWLYDRWARKYDQGKSASQTRDAEILARPLLRMLNGVEQPFILDVATGTGRMPLALCREDGFAGHIIAMDISQGMLEIAAGKLANHRKQVTLLHYNDFPLPFPDETFDAVSCMEALEVMPEMEGPLQELYRVLKPGGAFITSRGTEESGRKSKVRSAEAFAQLLGNTRFEQVEIIPWWKLFDRVRAVKPGTLVPAGDKKLIDALTCVECSKPGFETGANELKCIQCGNSIKLGKDGIVMYE